MIDFMELFKKKSSGNAKYKKVYISINEQLLADKVTKDVLDIQKIIEPLWWSVSIYDGEEKYENALIPFSLPQRYVFAIQWYSAEVNNGGHCQFYDNATGIVWEDALKGFETIGAYQNADIIRESANRIGGKPSKDHEKRQKQMENCHSEFNDLDKAYYNTEANMIIMLSDYIKNNMKDFLYSGQIIIPNLSE